MRNEITKRLDAVIALVEDMKEIMDCGDADAPQAFMEAAQDVQEQIGRILHDAICPILKERELD